MSPAVVIVALGVLAAAYLGASWLTAPALHLGARSGDWRAVTEGLRRARRPVALAGRGQALVHFHEMEGRGRELRLRVSVRNPNRPVRLAVRQDGRPVSAFEAPEIPIEVTVPVPAGAASLEVEIEAVPAQETSRPLYLIHDIVLDREGGRLVPVFLAALALALFAGLARVGPIALAVAWTLLLTALVAGILVTAVDPLSALRLTPDLRFGLRLAGIAAAWTLALAVPRRLTAMLALAATPWLLYGPSLGYGFVTDDFYFARPLTVPELLSTLHGQWDPKGNANAHYRPVVAWSLAADYAVWGARTLGYHLTNLVLQSAVALTGLFFLERLGLSLRAALAGALLFAVHPLGAAAAAWANERTDGLLALFYLGTLSLLGSARFTRRHLVATLVLGAVALGSKEMAVTLPLIAFLVLRGRPGDGNPLRRRAVFGLTALVVGYVALWVSLFPGKAAAGTALGGKLAALGVDSPWLVPAALLGPVFAPLDYASWSTVPVGDRHPAYLLAAVAVAPLLAFLAGRSKASGVAPRIAWLGVAWPLLALLPLLPLRGGLDLYRVGLLLAVGPALLWAALVAAWGERRGAVATVLLGLGLAPVAMRAGEAWGPGGLAMAAGIAWKQDVAEWEGTIGPEMAAVFRRQVMDARHRHEPEAGASADAAGELIEMDAE